MEGILNFGDKFDIQLFEKVVATVYQGRGLEQQNAQKLMTQFQEHPDSWTKVDVILEQGTSQQAKFLALQILESLIVTKWNALPREQCLGIRNYVVSLLIRYTSSSAGDDQALQKQAILINKLNLVLIQILKHEWPRQWPTFIPELVASSHTSIGLCENTMTILRLLSEEIFDFSASQMTTIKAKGMKQQFCGEFSAIFQLLKEVLEKAQKTSLIRAALEALLRFLRWIPLGYIFETNLIDLLRDRFLSVPAFRSLTVACLAEIVGQPIGTEYQEKILGAAHSIMSILIQKLLPLTQDLDVAKLYQQMGNDNQIFIQNLALFLTTLLDGHLPLFEAKAAREDYLAAHHYLLRISLVDDKEVFKVCLEYWAKLIDSLYRELPFTSSGGSEGFPPLMLGSIAQQNSRRSLYSEITSQLRQVLIQKMVKPEEVLVVQDENGEVVRETQKEVDTIAMYNGIRDVLYQLTLLDHEDMEDIMRNRLSVLFDPTNWNFDSINRLCWALGSISGAQSEADEKSFLVYVISELLRLCEIKKGKANKAIVASNVMYVVGQYPRFLKHHWKFLKTVVNKLFEFMHETHEGVQDMACETFLKIAQRTKRHLCTTQNGDQPFIEEIILALSQKIAALTDSQVQLFYEACATICSAEHETSRLNFLIDQLMQLLNDRWGLLVGKVAANGEEVCNPEVYKPLSHILRCNVAVCSAVGSSFGAQMSKVYLDILGLYKTASSIISDRVTKQGVIIATKTTQMRGLRMVRKDILRLIESYVSKIQDSSTGTLIETFVPALFEAILGDYRASVEEAREPEVLHVATTCFSKFGSQLSSSVTAVLDSVFESTLAMINRGFTEYPEHRQYLFRLISAINEKCFPALIQLNARYFRLIMDSIVWAFKHSMRDIADIGLSTCLALIKGVASQQNLAVTSAFFQTWYFSLLQDIFYVMTDSSQKSGFKFHAEILSFLLLLVSRGLLAFSLQPQQSPDPSNNGRVVAEFVTNLLRSGFPHLQSEQIDTFVRGLFDLNGDLHQFKEHLRDFLIQCKEYAKNDPDLFREELELEQQRKAAADKEVLQRGGILGHAVPVSDLNDDDE